MIEQLFDSFARVFKAVLKVAVCGFLFLAIAGSGMPLIFGLIGAGAVAVGGFRWVFGGGSSGHDGMSFLDSVRQGIDRRLSERNALKDARRERSQENRFSLNPFKSGERGVAIGRYIDGKHLPVDMIADYSRDRLNPTFTCAGIEGLVTMRHKGLASQFVEYKFYVNDEKTALEMAKRAKRYDGAVKVFRDKQNRFVVTADNANDINDMAKAAFPVNSMNVSQDFDLIREYVVAGCSSYQEALEVVKNRKAGDPSFRPDATYSRLSVDIDGRRHVVSNGSEASKLNLSSGLEAGTFVIREIETTSTYGTVDVPADVKGFNLVNYVCEHLPEGSESETKTVFENVEADKGRYIKDSDGHNVELCTFGDGLYESDSLFVPFKDSASLLAFLAGGVIAQGSNALLGTPADGDLYVSLEPDMKLLTEVSSKRPVDEALVSRYEAAGLSGADIRWSLLLDGISKSGSSEVVAYKDIPLDGAKVCGVSADLLKERLSDKDLPVLDGSSLKEWLTDQERIGYVSLKVDPVNSELNIDAVIDGKPCAYESIRLTPEQLALLEARGGISEMQKREFLLQYDTDDFRSYDFKGREALANPVADFVKGQAPRRFKDISGYVEETRKHVNKSFKK